MDFYTIAVVFALGLGISFTSGFLGIGGGIIMAPALLYLLPITGAAPLDMKTVTGLTITQGLFACLSGAIRHGKYSYVSPHLVLFMGSTILVSALIGAVVSGWMSNNVLLGIFAVLALTAAVLMFIPRPQSDVEPSLDEVHFNKGASVAVAAAVGLLGGMVGQGGSFILIPLMLYVLRIPIRIALGSNLAIVFISSAAGFGGKLATGQVPFLLAFALVMGALPGAQLGGYVSKRTPPRILRTALACIIAFAAVRIWYDIFTRGF